jgi:hypothetical protein
MEAASIVDNIPVAREIRSCAEMFSLGTKHDDATVVVCVETFEGVSKRSDQCLVEEVRRWATNFDGRDVVVSPFDREIANLSAVTHFRFSSIAGARPDFAR